MNSSYVYVALASSLVLSVACVPTEVRTNAKVLALTTQSVQANLEQFSQSRELVTKARLRNMSVLEQEVLRVEQQMTVDSLVWKMTDPARLELLQSVIGGSNLLVQRRADAAAIRTANEKAIAAARSGVSLNASSMTKTAQALASLGKTPDVVADSKMLATYLKDVRTGIDSLRTRAKDQAESAAANATRKADVTKAPSP